MLRRLVAPVAVAAALVAVPPSAPAAPHAAEALVDTAPAVGATFRDRVVTGARAARRATARAAQASAVPYTAPDGQTVSVTLSPTYAASAAVAQSYVDFLGGLLHGDELGELAMYIGTPQEVTTRCGATGMEILACYLPAEELMVVPGEQAAGSTVTTSYVVAHEYGHHIANHRSNAPFSAMLFGPKRWASQEDVCTEALAGRLAPGDEGEHYASNPGEAWAETYAQLKYPQAAWSFTPLLRPSAASFAAARLDVTAPWTKRRTRTFRGSLGGKDAQDRHTFRLTLDGALTLRLKGASGTDFDLEVRSGGERQGRTTARGSRDVLTYAAACVEEPETVAVYVRRRSGAGEYTLTVASAG